MKIPSILILCASVSVSCLAMEKLESEEPKGQPAAIEHHDSTKIAIEGDAYFPVSKSPLLDDIGNMRYTQDGSFVRDSEGNYKNGSGYYLRGLSIESDTNVIGESLIGLCTSEVCLGQPTTQVDGRKACSPQAEVGQEKTISVQIYDSLGSPHSLYLTFAKLGFIQASHIFWSLKVSVPHEAAVWADKVDHIRYGFNNRGVLDVIQGMRNGQPPLKLEDTSSVKIYWNSGADTSTIALNLGQPGSLKGVIGQRVWRNNYDNMTPNGYPFGLRLSDRIDEDGKVFVKYDNGQEIPQAQIALARFPNKDLLVEESPGIFAYTEQTKPLFELPGKDIKLKVLNQ